MVSAKAAGEIHYLYIYDVGNEIELSKVEKVMNKLTRMVGLTFTRLMPKYIAIKPAPLLVNLGVRKLDFFGKEREVDVIVKLYEVGAISVTLVVPFEEELEQLIKYNTPKVKYRDTDTDLKKFCDELVGRVLDSIRESVKAAAKVSAVPEEYVSFCIRTLETKQTVDKFVSENKKVLTGILREEEKIKVISDDEIESALKYRISYYEDDVVLLDWSASVIVDPDGEFSDPLFTIELANLQLLELRSYDSIVGAVIDSAYDELKRFRLGWRTLLFGRPFKVSMDVATKRLEISDVIETTKNSVKFFGDWYVGKIYASISERLHLKDWDNILAEKMDTLEDIYTMTSDQIENSRSLWLEIIVVLLILIEIIIALPTYIK